MSKVNTGQASSTLIPKYIGSDFDKVVSVADNIEQVVIVSDNIEDVGTVADNINYVKEVAEDLHGMPVTMYTGENPPVLNPMPEGVMWYCTTDGRTYVWYTDADSGQWVESAPQSAIKDEATNIFFHSGPSNVNSAYRSATLYSTPSPEAEISVAHNALNTPVVQAQFIREEALWVDVSVIGAQGIVTLMGYSSGNSQLKAEIITWKNGAEGTSLGASQWVTLPSQPSVVSLPVTLANIDVLDAGDSYVVRLTSQMNAGGSAVSTILVDGNTSSRFGIIFNTSLIGLNDGIRDGVITSAPTENAVYDALQLKVGKSQLVQSGNLTSTANWSNVPAYSDSELGGSDGLLNAQAKALTARSELLLTDVREALRRSYAEAGLNLVDGSFEAGGTLVNSNDVLLQERTGKAFSGPAGTVAPGTNPVGDSDWAPRTDQLLRSDLAKPNGSELIGFQQNGLGAVLSTLYSKMRERVSVFDFMTSAEKADVIGRIGALNVTAAINKAVVEACARGAVLHVPNGLYNLVPATPKNDEAGVNICAIEMFSSLHIEADQGAHFRITDNFSTDANPKRHSMFFTNQVIQNLSFSGLTMDMNGQNNKISPGRPTTFNDFTNAQICVSGTQGGIAARANHVRIDNCQFWNNAGVSCIVAQQSNTVGVQLSDDWIITRSLFANVGLDCRDHSSIYGHATNFRMIGNVFYNQLPHNPTTHVGGLVACELHASGAVFTNNIIYNYMQGIWVAANFTESLSTGYIVSNNKAIISGTFLDFWSHNVLPYGDPEGAIQSVSITDNIIAITSDPVEIAVKSFLKLGARLQPNIVDFSNNICRSFDTGKDTVLCLAVVGPNQLSKADQIAIKGNTCTGLTNGLACYFGGDGVTATSQNVGDINYQNNDLGVLIPSPSAGYPLSDVYLYGPSSGKIESLRVCGLQKVDTPIVTDHASGGRARVFGQAIVPVTVTWKGVNVGTGTETSKIAINTDVGVAVINASLTAGATTVATGPVYPEFKGIRSDSVGCASVSHVKSGSATQLPAKIDVGSSWISLFGITGFAFGLAEFDGSSVLSVSANFPCRFADI